MLRIFNIIFGQGLKTYSGWKKDPEITFEFNDAEVELSLSKTSDYSGWNFLASYPPLKVPKVK